MRKKPPDGGLLLDSKDRRLKAECQECGVTFYVGHEETSQQTSKRRANLRRSINAAKKKMRRLEETDEAREARLQDDRANKESKRQAESEGVRTVRLQKQAVRHRIFVVRKRPQKLGHCVCRDKLSVNSLRGMK